MIRIRAAAAPSGKSDSTKSIGYKKVVKLDKKIAKILQKVSSLNFMDLL
jgi:hypothetical protein